jgi:hypothetical protein
MKDEKSLEKSGSKELSLFWSTLHRTVRWRTRPVRCHPAVQFTLGIFFKNTGPWIVLGLMCTDPWTVLGPVCIRSPLQRLLRPSLEGQRLADVTERSGCALNRSSATQLRKGANRLICWPLLWMVRCVTGRSGALADRGVFRLPFGGGNDS